MYSFHDVNGASNLLELGTLSNFLDMCDIELSVCNDFYLTATVLIYV